MSPQKFAYEEPKQALNSRISAHSKYSNFNLHHWIQKKFSIKPKSRILDLGCGNGNFTTLFREMTKEQGEIWGLDKNPQLIEEAKQKHAAILGDKVKFMVQDFDLPFPKQIQDFNWAFAIYSLYYTENSLRILQTVRDFLTQGGSFVVIGPGPLNARDLSEFNYEMTGQKPKPEYDARIERIAKEFKPLFRKIFAQSNVEYEEIDSVMEFPTAESYAEYYWSTLLWRESVAGRSPQEIKKLQEQILKKVSMSLPAKINKQISCLVGRRI